MVLGDEQRRPVGNSSSGILSASDEAIPLNESTAGRGPAAPPHIEHLHELFRQLDLTITTIQRYGWEHNETQRRLDVLLSQLVRGLSGPTQSIQWYIQPHSFVADDHVVWEPQGACEDIPYHLFAGGFRSMTIFQGFGRKELGEWLRWLSLDPEEDLPPEDDLATVFWELNLSFVDYQIITLMSLPGRDSELFRAQYDAVQSATTGFLDNADDLRASLNTALGRQYSSGAEQASMAKVSPSLRPLSPRVAEPAREELVEESRVLHQRLGRVTAVSFLDGISVGDEDLIEGPLAELRGRYIEAGHFADLLELYSQLVIGLFGMTQDMAFGPRIIPPEALGLVLERLAIAAHEPHNESWAGHIATPLSLLLDYMPDNYFEPVLHGLTRTPNRTVRLALLRFLERTIDGHERVLGDPLEQSDSELARVLIKLLKEHGTNRALETLRRAMKHDDPAIHQLALDARAHIDPADVANDLKDALVSDSAKLRSQAIRLIGVLKLRRLLGPLCARCRDKIFHHLPKQEKTAILDLIHLFDPKKAEDTAIELTHVRAIADRSRQETQMVVVDFLSRHGKTPGALSAVSDVAKGGLLKNREVRDSAVQAAELLKKRLGDD